jgi:hypothetical protein
MLREDMEPEVNVLFEFIGTRKLDCPPTKFLGRECLLEAQYAHRGCQSTQMVVEPEKKQLPLLLVPIGAERFIDNWAMAEGG